MANIRRVLINLRRTLNSVALPNQSSISAVTFSCVQLQTQIRPQYGWVSHFSSDINNNGTQSMCIDLSDKESKRRLFNRLIYRSKQRGFLELDLVLGKWVEEHIHAMDESGIKALVYVLDLENPVLWNWLTGQEQPPEAVKLNPVFTALHNKVMNNLNRHAAPETRAEPGQPWVRGWDDFKKGRDSPITGNQ